MRIVKDKKEKKQISRQDFEDYLQKSQKAFSQRIKDKADEAGVVCDVRIWVDIKTSNNPIEE